VSEAALHSAQKKVPRAKRFTDFRKPYEAALPLAGSFPAVASCVHFQTAWFKLRE